MGDLQILLLADTTLTNRGEQTQRHDLVILGFESRPALAYLESVDIPLRLVCSLIRRRKRECAALCTISDSQ
jgi:hypothetical protein